MAHPVYKLMEIIGYILTPEFSPENDPLSRVSLIRQSSQKRLLGHAKSTAWILLSIMLSLAVGQLN